MFSTCCLSTSFFPIFLSVYRRIRAGLPNPSTGGVLPLHYKQTLGQSGEARTHIFLAPKEVAFQLASHSDNFICEQQLHISTLRTQVTLCITKLVIKQFWWRKPSLFNRVVHKIFWCLTVVTIHPLKLFRLALIHLS